MPLVFKKNYNLMGKLIKSHPFEAQTEPILLEEGQSEQFSL